MEYLTFAMDRLRSAHPGIGAVVVLAVVLAVVVTAVAATIAAVVDLRQRRLPDRWVLLAGAAPVVAVVTGTASAPAVIAGAGLAGVPLLLIHLVAPTAIGFGDVKFAAVLGATCGLVDARIALVAVCLASVVTVVAGLAARQTDMPFGPGLWFGTAVACVVAPAAGPTAVQAAADWIVGGRT